MDTKSNEEMVNSPNSPSSKQDFEINNYDSKLAEAGELRIVLPGDYIGESLIAGHGTYESKKDNKIYANMAGVVH